jgi:hypothetical protein
MYLLYSAPGDASFFNLAPAVKLWSFGTVAHAIPAQEAYCACNSHVCSLIGCIQAVGSPDAMLSQCGTHPTSSRPLWQQQQQNRAAARSQPVLLRAFGKSPAMQEPTATAQQVPQTWGDVQRVFLSHPSAAVPAAGIVGLVATRLQQQPLSAIDLSGELWQTPLCSITVLAAATPKPCSSPLCVPAAVGAGVVAFWLVQEWMVHKWLLHSSWNWAGGSLLCRAAAFDPV